MPKHKPPGGVWRNIRKRIWQRDGECCVRCHCSLTLKEANIDHIISGKLGTNSFDNLRTLCRPCHALRADFRHRGLIEKALADGNYTCELAGLALG